MTFESWLDISWEIIIAGVYAVEELLFEYTRTVAGNREFDE